MDQADIHVHVVPPSAATDEPSLGAIKRALHQLSLSTATSKQCDAGKRLREAHELLRQLARRNGIDPDTATQRRRAALKSQRERLVLASSTASD